MGNPLKKAVKAVGKAIKNPIKYNPFTLAGRGFYEGFDAVRDNWTDIRTPLAYGVAGALIASGIGAGLGATGLAGMTAGAGAIGGATAGAAAGTTAGLEANAAAKAAKEQERIAAQEAEAQRKLALQQAGATPDAVTDLNTEAKRRMRSQYQRNLVSRNKANKSLGGSSSTLA